MANCDCGIQTGMEKLDDTNLDDEMNTNSSYKMHGIESRYLKMHSPHTTGVANIRRLSTAKKKRNAIYGRRTQVAMTTDGSKKKTN